MFPTEFGYQGFITKSTSEYLTNLGLSPSDKRKYTYAKMMLEVSWGTAWFVVMILPSRNHTWTQNHHHDFAGSNITVCKAIIAKTWTRWTTSFGHTSRTSPTWPPTTPKRIYIYIYIYICLYMYIYIYIMLIFYSFWWQLYK